MAWYIDFRDNSDASFRRTFLHYKVTRYLKPVQWRLTVWLLELSAVRFGKSMFNPQRQMSLSDAYEFAGNIMADNMMSPDAGEGIDAFLAKRAPIWEKPVR